MLKKLKPNAVTKQNVALWLILKNVVNLLVASKAVKRVERSASFFASFSAINGDTIKADEK
jgi:hypothetical protein